MSRTPSFADRLRLPFAKRERRLSFAWFDVPSRGEWARSLAIATCVGALLAVAGAFGTDPWPLARRLLYWVPLIMLITPIGMLAGASLGSLPPRLRHPILVGAGVTSIVAAPGALLVWLYTSAWRGFVFDGGLLLGVAAPTFAISAVMTALILLADRPGAQTKPADVAAPSTARFLDRFPPQLRGAALYAVRAEDHYLRLYTSKGDDLILMRLGDAVLELDGIEGAQVHRSWWVARAAVTAVRREDGKITLALPGGVVAPVSRANVRSLRDAGWI